jgi:hypothetical protein
LKFSFSIKLTSIVCLVSLFLLLLATSLVHAEEAATGSIIMKALGDQASSGYFIVEGSPGQKKQVTVNLRNTSDQESEIGEFMVADAPNAQGGGIGAIDPEHLQQEQVGSWFQVKKESVQLKSGESRNVTLDFTIPSGTRPGDHMGAISLYQFEPGAKPDKMLNKNEAAVVVNKAYSQIIAVLVKVPGLIEHKIEMKSLEPKLNGSILFMDLTIANQGNVIEDRSQGVIQISQGGKLLFEKKGEMKSIYPGNSAIFSFEAPTELMKRGKYDSYIIWHYASGKQEEHTSMKFEISPKQIKQAIVADLAIKGEKNISRNTIVLNPSDIWRFLIIGVVALVTISVIFMILFKRKGKRKDRSRRPYPTIEG